MLQDTKKHSSKGEGMKRSISFNQANLSMLILFIISVVETNFDLVVFMVLFAKSEMFVHF